MDLENNQEQPNSGLLRFRSAPSSLFANSSDHIDSERFFSRSVTDFDEKSSSLPLQYPRAISSIHIGVDGGYGDGGNLVRLNSSPVDLFANHNAQNGYAGMRGAENFRVGNYSRLGLLSQISGFGNENNGANRPEAAKISNRDTHFYGSRFPVNSWNNTSQFMDDEDKLFSGTENGDRRNLARVLSHSLSLPKTSMEMATMEKLMQLHDSVPFKIRAKRGCATHPRSIAERVRRTRISERMRKLQELVPNMEKQTNTADMLDLAVDHIKDLQRQFKILSDNRAKCKCSSAQRSIPNKIV